MQLLRISIEPVILHHKYGPFATYCLIFLLSSCLLSHPLTMDQPQTPFDPQSAHNSLVSLLTGLDNKVNVLSDIVRTNSTGLDELNKRFNSFHKESKGLSDNVAANTQAINNLKSTVEDLSDQVQPLDQELEELRGDLGKVSKDLGERFDKVDEDLRVARRCLEEKIGEVKDDVSQVNQRLNKVEERLTARIEKVDEDLRVAQRCLEEKIGEVKDDVSQVDQRLNKVEERLTARINMAEERLGGITKKLRTDINKTNDAIHKLNKTTQDLSKDLYSVDIARGHVSNLQEDVQKMSVTLEAQRKNELARLANSFVGNGTIEPLVAMDMSRISDLPSSDAGIDHLQGRPQ